MSTGPTRTSCSADAAPEATRVAPMPDLRVLSSARWPENGRDTPDALPPLPGFILSSFNPLAAVVAERCLARRPPAHAAAPGTDGPPRRTAVLLASVSGDLVSARELAAAVGEGRRVAPLLFFQSNPNAVLGRIAARHGLIGPVVCLGPAPGGPDGLRAAARAEALLLLLDGDADEVLVIRVEQNPDSTDEAEAVLVGPPLPAPGPSWPPLATDQDTADSAL